MPNTKGVSLARFYYDQILAALMTLKTSILPWHTETDPYDPINGMLQSKAFVGHRDATAIDRAAESFSWLAYATRPEAIALARLQGYRLKRDLPATAGILGTLTAPLTIATTLVKQGALCSTERAEDGTAVTFEHLDDDLIADPCNLTIKRWNGAAFVAWVPTDPLFSNPPVVDECLYIGHPQLMFDRLVWALSTPNNANAKLSAEYFDEKFVGAPAVVAVSGGNLVFTVGTFLGSSAAIPRTGLAVTVTHRPTGVYATGIMVLGAETTVEITGYLGQAVPSILSGDYEVSTTWTPFRSAATPTEISGVAAEQLLASGETELLLPHTASRKWVKTTIDSVEAYWMRYRVTKVAGGAVQPVATTILPTAADWYAFWEPVQGQTVEEEIADADGTDFQVFPLAYTPYIDGSVSLFQVGTDPDWSELESLYYADGDTKAFVVEETTAEAIQCRTGNGTNGLKPTLGQAVRVAYRIGASEDGNCGAGTVIVAKSGITGLATIANPRAGTGWTQKEGVDAVDLDRIRYLFPARIRAGSRAVTAGDYETIAIGDFLANGGNPVRRAIAVEEGSGPKTVLLVVSGVGGFALTTAELTALEEWFNGEVVDLQRIGGVGLLNSECVPVNYIQKTIAVTATVTFLRGYGTGKQGRIQQALAAVLVPDATMATWKTAIGQESEVVPDDFSDYLWRLDSEVQIARLMGVILQAAGSGVVDAVMALPAANVALTGAELPYPGVITITIVEI